MEEIIPFEENDHIHSWFELTYAQYLTIPRSVLQSMPGEWQKKFVELLNELDDTIDWRPKEGIYRVRLYTTKEVYDKKEDQYITKWGHEIPDPLMNYQRGRRQIPHIEKTIYDNPIYKAGYELGLKGKISTNDNVSHFSDEERKLWDQGKTDGETMKNLNIK
jgi:hypothetical protein